MEKTTSENGRNMRHLGLLILVGILCLGITTQAIAETTAIYGVIIDGTGNDPIMDGVVVVSEDRIDAVGSTADVMIPEGAREVRLANATILPGFIDAHVHKAYDASVLSRWAASGVTTVRDLGADPEMDWDAVRDGFAMDPSLATLVISGPLVTVPNGYALRHGFPLAVAVASPAEARTTIRSFVSSGVDIIKIAIDSQSPIEEVMSLDVAKAIVEAAHEQGVLVVAHAIYNEDLLIALEAGVDQLAHVVKGGVRIATIQTIVDRDIIMVSTLAIAGRGSSYMRNFVASGGLVALGTDSGAVGPVPAEMPIEEFHRMMRSGLDARGVIVASTRNAALACGIEEEVGTLEIGKLADILVVAGDPLEEITVLGEAAFVMHHGTVVHEVPAE